MHTWNRILGPVAIGVLATALVGCAAFAAYGSSSRIPAGVHLGNWPVGGITYAEFDAQVSQRKAAFLGQSVKLSVPPADGTGGGSAQLTLGQLGIELDEQPLRQRIASLREGSLFHRARARWQARGSDWAIRPVLAPEKLGAALQEAFAPVYREQPKDAVRIIRPDDTIDYAPEKPARRIDEPQLGERLAAALPAWEVQVADAASAPPLALDVPMRTVNPAVTVQSLQQQGIVRKIGEFATRYPPAAGSAAGSAGRLHNVQATAASLQDVLLAPGAVFDYAPFIEQTEKTAGYREAPVIVNGKLVPGIGGGICQVSSTLYNAVLRAGLTIVERRNHSLPVSYVPLGQDATFASGHINFKFRNSTNFYMLIRTYADGSELKVKLFGQTPPDTTFDVESVTVDTLQPSTKYVHNPSLRKGKSEIVVKGKPGYIVETYRIQKKNGNIIGREKISRDTYAAQPTVIAINTGSGSGADRSSPHPTGDSPVPYVEDGVKGPSFR